MTKRKSDFSQFNKELIDAIRDPQNTGSDSFSLIGELTPFGKTVHYANGEHVLKAGELNDSLYFLIEGGVNVIIGDEIVAALKRKGDIVGEMSIISKSFCNADVISVEPTSMLKVAIESLKEKSSDYELLLYKIFCLTLSEKLDNTNIKAKQFEVLNRTLEDEVKRRTNELSLGYKKLEFERIDNLNSILAKKINEIKCNPNLSVDKLIKDYD